MIHFILGTKAQLIKTAPVMCKLREQGIEYNYVFTGQHRETMSEIENNFKIDKPDYTIYDGADIVSKKQMIKWFVFSLCHVTKNRIKIFKNDKNGIVLVHGDTVSTVLGAILGKICGHKVGHIESGLRSFNFLQPFPEELCRIITFNLSDYYFCPGSWALSNLSRYQGIKINTENNTLYDALKLSRETGFSKEEVNIPPYTFGVVTLHRFENLQSKDRLIKIVSLLELISESDKLIFILHKPTEIKLKRFGLFDRLVNNQNIELRNRYPYFSFMKLLDSADFVVSDGGSNQEECFYLGKPLLLFRNLSERQEGIGRNVVVTNFDGASVKDFLANKERYRYEFLELESFPSKIIVDAVEKYK